MKRVIPKISLLILILLSACNMPETTIGAGEEVKLETATFAFLPPNYTPGAPLLTPTPDSPHSIPALRAEAEQYVVQPGDTLRIVANVYGISLDRLLAANQIANPDILSVGQVLQIPPPVTGAIGPADKLIPDSELVNGPYNANFDLNAFIASHNGHLALYREEVEGRNLSGAEIVALVAGRYSVNPRLLLAVLEHQSGWLTQAQTRLDSLSFPIGREDPSRAGLFKQLSWAADNLNRGYYLWRVDGLGAYTSADGILIPAASTINAGTAGVHYLFALLYDEPSWRGVVSISGFAQTYRQLYGDPFAWAFEPLLPLGLAQPTFQLPFEPGIAWTFTGGPHGGWDNGSAWAAIDFAPPMAVLGCNTNDNWVVAVADGLIVRAENGAVVQDLDGDGFEQTGWTVLYMHTESRDRVAVGAYVRAGERIGHPSCEGGFATGTHLHIARRYNGEWIPADGPIPFVLDGWVSVGTGQLYDGFMQRDGQSVEACECQEPEHTLQR